MKNILKCLIAMVFLLSPLTLWAHANHGSFDPVDEGQANEVAVKVVQSLVDKNQLSKSWKSVKPLKASNFESRNGPVWMITMENPQEEDKKKAKLFVFVDEFGNPVAVNHEGKLE